MPNAGRFGSEIHGDWSGDKVISTSNRITATIGFPGKDSSRTDSSNDAGLVGSESPTESSVYTPNPEPPWDPAIGVSRAPDATQRQVRTKSYATPEGWVLAPACFLVFFVSLSSFEGEDMAVSYES
jgi:hypothetical protein